MTHFGNVWLPRGNPVAKAAVRLFCFHHAGGSSTAFREWQQAFPAQIQVCPVELPGHGARALERPYVGMPQLIEALEEGLGPWLEEPFAFFGHSMGAAIAFELAQRVRASRGVQPLHLFLSSRRGPGRPAGKPIHTLPERDFVEEIRRLNGTAEELLSNPEVLAFVVPMLRADFELIETATPAAPAALDCPITAFGGLEDPTVDREDLQAWRHATTAAFRLEMLAGDHFFIASARGTLIQMLTERLLAPDSVRPAGVSARCGLRGARDAAPPTDPVRLPFEHQPKASSAAPMKRVQRPAPAELLARVTESANALSVSVEAFRLATWHILLWRLCRQPAIATGLLRRDGFLCVRSDLSERARFSDIVRACNESLRDRAVTQPAIDAGDYLFISEDALPSAPLGKAHLYFSNDEVVVRYDESRFRREDVTSLAEQYIALLGSSAADPQRFITSLSLNGRLHEELLDSVRSNREWPMPLDICKQFEQRVEESPAAIAAVASGDTLTYAELNSRANRLAHFLRERGVGVEVRVGLLLDRNCSMLVAILAVLKAGGTYVPVDVSAPRDRLAWIMQNSGARFLLSEGELAKAIGEVGLPVIDMLEERERLGRYSDENLPNTSQPADAAYILHTSGSTGQPKGVCVTRHNVARLFQCTESLYRFSSADVWSVCHSYAFDYSVWEIWGAWLYGGKVVLASHAQTRSPDALYQLLERERVTILSQTPAGFRTLLRELQRVPGRALSARAVVFGGEALEPNMLDELRKQHPEMLLVNMYGITETTVHSTYKFLSAEDTARAGRSPIGLELPDTRIYVLNADLEEVGLWETGEIFIGGPSVARGYVGRPDLTADRFMPEPRGVTPGARLYRSGDLARRRSNGELEYVGRGDHQVKIRGYRIELGEIEAALRKLQGVREAAVLLREEGGEKRLVAYVFNRAGHQPSTDELRNGLRQFLPEYMIPAAFVLLEQMPLTANGKLDRRALPEPSASKVEQKQDYVAPGTGVEESIARIWAQALRVDSVGVQDNFFDIGGHSLLLLEIHERLRQELSVDIDAIELFANPTVRSLARFIAGQERVAAPATETLRDGADRRRAARKRRESRDAARAQLAEALS